MARIDLKHLSWGDALRIGVPLLAVILLAFYVTSRFVKPAPPGHVVLSTGAPGGAYERYAKRYQAFFARNGVTLELRPSEGAVENLKRLDGGGVDAAFVQGGIATPVDEDAASPIVSLGALYLEPVWVFARDARRSRRTSSATSQGGASRSAPKAAARSRSRACCSTRRASMRKARRCCRCRPSRPRQRWRRARSTPRY